MVDDIFKIEFTQGAEDDLEATAPVNFIVHSLNDVNAQLERGRPFFIDIISQGVTLYESEGFPFAQPRALPPEEALAEAREYFDKWFPSAVIFTQTATFAMSKGGLKEAAFLLHQATERLYHTVLLTLTLYSPKSHRLNFLRSHCEEIAPELIAAWPRNDKFSRRGFELLRQAYVNARYSPHYEISEVELEWLGERVGVLQGLVRVVSERRLGAHRL